MHYNDCSCFAKQPVHRAIVAKDGTEPVLSIDTGYVFRNGQNYVVEEPQNLSAIVTYFKKHPGKQLYIRGLYAPEEVEASDSIHLLGKQRAEVLQLKLLKQGVSPEQLNIEAKESAGLAFYEGNRYNCIQLEVGKRQFLDEVAALKIKSDTVRLHFESGRTDFCVSGKSLEYFKQLRNYLWQEPERQLVIEAHSDNEGDDESNVGLSLQRAISVQEALVELGAPNEQIEVTAMGEKKPLCDTKDKGCMRLNRRVELHIE